jgi:hypothetical protein
LTDVGTDYTFGKKKKKKFLKIKRGVVGGGAAVEHAGTQFESSRTTASSVLPATFTSLSFFSSAIGVSSETHKMLPENYFQRSVKLKINS